MGINFQRDTFRITPQNCFRINFVRGLLGTGHPDPSLESASPSPPRGSIRHRFGIEIGSNQEIDVESMSNRCWIDANSTPEEGRARRIRGWGPGGLCLINPSQNQLGDHLGYNGIARTSGTHMSGCPWNLQPSSLASRSLRCSGRSKRDSFATKLASDCECDGLVHPDVEPTFKQPQPSGVRERLRWRN